MAEPLKNMYNPEFVGRLASAVKTNYGDFDEKRFTKAVINATWDDLELKARMLHIAGCLHRFLPNDYPTALDVLSKCAHQFTGFAAVLFPTFVELYGLDNYEDSMNALEYFTRFSTAEYAIRPFIIQDQKQTMQKMMEWSQHENHHVRRLASEGCRPRLPWGMALKNFQKDPAPILPILENLKNDESEYVRKSVANNLNDISKDNPDLVLTIAKKWLGKNANTNWIVKHACRTLLKKANSAALELFGLNQTEGILVEAFVLAKKKLCIGETLEFSLAIKNSLKKTVTIRLEYGIDFMKANGTHSRKLFKITENTWDAGQILDYNRRHSFKDLTTRKHYPGKHEIAIIVNGKEMAKEEFELLN